MIKKVCCSFAQLIASTFLLLHYEATTVSSSSETNLRRKEIDTDPRLSITSSDNKRQLSLVSAFSDPHSTVIKIEQYNEVLQETPKLSNSLRGLDANGNQRPLNILALGGSVTWGAKLSNRFEQTYPKLIGAPNFDHVDNFAIRATGADYPSLCIESMLASKAEVGASKSYDVIFFEFVMNGMNGLNRLMRRLRQRFPDAVIVFVRLWSVLGDAKELGTNRTVFELGKDASIEWVWREKAKLQEILRDIKSYVVSDEIQGYVYELPKPESPMDAIEKGWFADDWQHLSEDGHAFLADDIVRLLTSTPEIIHHVLSSEKSLGLFSWQDQCYNWFESGYIPPPPEIYFEGAQLRDILSDRISEFKWLLEFSNAGGIIKFNSKFPHSVPIGLGYMTRREPAEYPLVEILVNGANPIVLNPNQGGNMVIPTAHIVTILDIGFAEPGENIITIKPLEERRDPFRVSGLLLRGVMDVEEEKEVEFHETDTIEY